MNDLGTLLSWSALQATLVALAAAAVYPFAARRRPAAGAAVAAAGLAGSIVLMLLAFCPLPSWWDWRPPVPAVSAPPEAARVEPPVAAEPAPGAASDAPAAPANGPSWPVHLMRLTWNHAGRAAAPFADRSQSGWAVAAMVFLAGAAIGLLRLGGGLWAVAVLRLRSRPILDESMVGLMRQLREDMAYRGPVELRECHGLGAPAAAGWLRPVVLLPADWRAWDECELRAALAHELAHVRRSDYLLGLLARLGLALHFYHPLLYWLAGRLRLQQELAADGLAAPSAGGRDAYLLGLARLALRLNDRRPTGWPANPLFSRGMLMRRIQMLKTRDGCIAGSPSRWGRISLTVLAAAAVIGVAALRCPAQKTAAPTPPVYAVAFADSGIVDEKAASPAALEPFDLSYLPPDAMGVACFRPSAVLSRHGLKKYADDANKGLAAYCKAVALPRGCGLPIEEIAQVSMTFRVVTDKKAKGAQSALLCGTPVMIRATKEFDWGKELKELIAGVKESRHSDRVIYHLPTDGPLAPMFGGAKICYFVPDGRTVVFDTEEGLAARIDRKAGAAPAWAADFKCLERGIAAVVLDNRDGAWARELSARDKPEPEIAPFLDHTSWVVFGASADDGVTCDAAVRFDGEETAAKATKAIDGWLSGARTSLAASPENASYSLLKALVEKPELKREGASIRLRCHADGDATQWLLGILDEEGGMQSAGPKP